MLKMKMLTRLPGKIQHMTTPTKRVIFFTPMRFGRVLPPDHSPHGMGVRGPPYDGLRGHVLLI